MIPFIIESIKTKKELKAIFERGLATLYIDIFSYPPYEEKFSPSKVKMIFQKILSAGGDILVMSQGNDILGFAAGFKYKSGTYWFEELGTNQKYRRKGFAKALIKKIITLADNDSNISEICLTTDHKNKAAITLYEQFGFTIKSYISVPSYKKEGLVKLDRRVLMQKTLQQHVKSIQQPVLNKVAIVSPGGNITAFVFDEVPQKLYTYYTNSIIRALPNVEQVAFIKRTPKDNIRLEMMGLEFSGNATRALGRILLDNPIKSISIESSGIDSVLKLERHKTNDEISVNIPLSIPAVTEISRTRYLIELPGISHLIVFESYTKDKVTRLVHQMLEITKAPAFGIIFSKKLNEKELTINPFIYVKQTETLVNEQSCASGSLALAYWSYINSKQSTAIVDQPSNNPLMIKIAPTSATIRGEVKLLNSGRIIKTSDTNLFYFEKNPLI